MGDSTVVPLCLVSNWFELLPTIRCKLNLQQLDIHHWQNHFCIIIIITMTHCTY